MTTYVRVMSRNPFQVTMFEAVGDGLELAYNLRKALRFATGEYEIDTLTQEEIDAIMLERLIPENRPPQELHIDIDDGPLIA